MVASPEVIVGLIWCCSLTVASVLEVFGSWLSWNGWLGAGLRDGCGDCLEVLVAFGLLVLRGGMRGRRSGVG